MIADEAMEDGGDVIADTSDGNRPEGDSDADIGDDEELDFDMEAPGTYRISATYSPTRIHVASHIDDPDMTDEELKKRAAARARAIMARKKREAADFDEEVAGERSRAGNVTGKPMSGSDRSTSHLTWGFPFYSFNRSTRFPESPGRWRRCHGHATSHAASPVERLSDARSLLASSPL